MRIFKNILLVWLIGLILLGLSLGSLSIIYAAGYSSILPTSLETDDTSYILVDDFDNGNYKINKLGGVASCGGTSPSLITCTNPVNETNGFLQMHYDVGESSSDFVLYTSDLISRNLTDFDTAWVTVQGDKGLEPIEVEFVECTNPSYPKIFINDHLIPGIPPTPEWSAAAIPIASFNINRTCISKINILARRAEENNRGKIFVDDIRLLPANVLVDDFNNSPPDNELGGGSGIWPNDGSITYNYLDGELELKYNVRKTNTFSEAVYWTRLGNTKLLLRKDALLFKIRGDKGAKFGVQFMDCGPTGTSSIKVNDYLREEVRDEVKYVTIPLAAFTSGMDWRCIKEFKFLFSAHPWIDSGQGTVYVDDITLAPSSHPLPLLIDHFDDCNNWNALLGSWSKAYSGNTSIEYRIDNEYSYSNGGCSLKASYIITGDTYALIGTELRGLDVRDYTHLRFFLKGANGNEELNFRLFDKNGNFRIYENVRITKDWREILLPLSFFSPKVNLANLSQLTLAFEWKSMSGTIYLDEMSFIKPKLMLPLILKKWPPGPLVTNLYLRNHTGGNVSYSVHGIDTKIVPDTFGKQPVFWGSFPVGTYNVSWFKISDPSCKNSGTRTYPVGYFEPPSPMVCH